MSNKAKKIGFIGLGIMGAPMALNLMKAGHKLFTHTRSKTPDDLTNGGATLCTTNKGVAERADIIFLMVPTRLRSRKCCLVRTALSKA